MQQTKVFDLHGDGMVNVKFDEAFVYIEASTPCCANCRGGKLYVRGKNNQKLCLGTLNREGDKLHLFKSYPLSYFASNDIYIDEISSFYTESMPTDDSCEKNDEPYSIDDPAVKRAENTLNMLSENADFSREANYCRQKISSEFHGKLQTDIPHLKNFKWYEMKNIRQSFDLSSLEHLIFNEFFVRAYAQSGKWYFGVGDEKNMYAVCIGCASNSPNPFENAMDCVTQYETDSVNECYYAVGIALLDDGQYFYKIHGK